MCRCNEEEARRKVAGSKKITSAIVVSLQGPPWQEQVFQGPVSPGSLMSSVSCVKQVFILSIFRDPFDIVVI